VAEHVLADDPAASVGVLTPRRAELVSGANLARWAGELGLGARLRLGRGEDQTGGRGRESILATALEALLGAIYLESGLPAVRGLVGRLAGWSAPARGRVVTGQ
jgi:ribonuclease-3